MIHGYCSNTSYVNTEDNCLVYLFKIILKSLFILANTEPGSIDGNTDMGKTVGTRYLLSIILYLVDHPDIRWFLIRVEP